MSWIEETLPVARHRARIAGAVAGAALLAGFFFGREQFFQSYLFAWLFVLGLGLGCLAIYMLHNLTGGAWGMPVRRVLEAAVRTLPVLALMFLPILGGIGRLYVWADADKVAADHVLQHKAAYLNVPFFILRAILYFAIWLALARQLLKLSERYERTGDPQFRHRRATLSAAGLVVYVLTITFASVDWAMSVEAHWFSTAYGLQFLLGQVLSAFALVIFCSSRAYRDEPAASAWSRDQFNDLGNLLLAFVMLWAYIAVTQFIIVWSGNLPEETPWYLRRAHTSWKAVALAVVIFHFAVPFLVLLARRNKRNTRMLARLAVGLMVIRVIETYWLVMPGFFPDAFHLSVMDLLAPVALGGAWFWHFARNLAAVPIVYEPPAETEWKEAPAS